MMEPHFGFKVQTYGGETKIKTYHFHKPNFMKHKDHKIWLMCQPS